METLSDLIAEHDFENVYSCDEINLFLCAIRYKTMCFKTDVSRGGMRAKEVLLVLLFYNMEGEFEKKIVIKKSD